MDPTGNDCIYSDDVESTGTVTITTGDCKKKGGTYVDGTVDTKSLTYKQGGSIGYAFTGAKGAIGAGVIERDQSDRASVFISEMAARADTSNGAIAEFMIGTTAAGAALGVAPALAGAANEFAFGSSMGRLFFEGAGGGAAAAAFGVGRTLRDSPVGSLYDRLGEPLGRAGWSVLSRFWASGASGTANIFPTFTNPNSLLWKPEFQTLLKNPGVRWVLR